MYIGMHGEKLIFGDQKKICSFLPLYGIYL